LLLERAVVPLVAFFELFFVAAVFLRTDAFFADFFEVLVFRVGLFVDFTFLPEAFFELVDLFLFFFFMAIRAV
jgi:hypothetical protein